MQEIDYQCKPDEERERLEDEELLLKEVIRGDADLYYLHHYLSEVFSSSKGSSQQMFS